MSLDHHLPEELRRAAEGHTPPVPDLAAVVHGGRRRRRARNLRRGAVIAACVTVAVAVPFVLDPFDTGSPGPSKEVDVPGVARVMDLPVGAAPAIPHCPGDGSIHGAGDPVDVRCDVLIHRADTTLYLSRRGVAQLTDGRATLLDSRTWSSWVPALSLDGRWAAWVTETPGGPSEALLLGFDLQSGTSVEVPWPTSNGWVAGIDDLGRVYFEDFETTDITTYDLRTGETTDVKGVPAHTSPSIKYVNADGFGLLTVTDGFVEGMVTADGSFTQQRQVDRSWSHYSPDRERVVHERSSDLVVEPTNGDGPAVPLKLPQEGEPVWFPVWESPDSLIVQFDPTAVETTLASINGLDSPAQRTWLLRCDAVDGTCEVALRPGWGDGMRGPVYR